MKAGPTSCLLVSKLDRKCVALKKVPSRAAAAFDRAAAVQNLDVSCEPGERREAWAMDGSQDYGQVGDRDWRRYEFSAAFGVSAACSMRRKPSWP